ncbi:MAG: nucleotide exchange factor GrpE [Candidatus Nomurabacteria bacterium]|jgi:molecular chaperone GrpE|nr:nucleotide exchange factor GrpE [Candidatus Nomurabacteria bacterium]
MSKKDATPPAVPTTDTAQPTTAQATPSALPDTAQLTADLQRLRADFENYRKNTDREKSLLVAAAERKTIAKMLPILDDIELAAAHIPADLADNTWAQGIAGLTKKLDITLAALGVAKIPATAGTKFDPNFHEAVASGENGEQITAELRSGYTLNGEVIRPAMVNTD